MVSDLLASPVLMGQALKSFHGTIRRTAQNTVPLSPAPHLAEASTATNPAPATQEEANLPNQATLPVAPSPTPETLDISNYVSSQTAIDDYPQSTQPSELRTLELQTSGPQVVDVPGVSRCAKGNPEIDQIRNVQGNGLQSLEYPVTKLEPSKRREEETELVFPAPLDLHKLMLISKKLQEKSRVKIIGTSGSWEEGT
jgi:hypothetical protein